MTRLQCMAAELVEHIDMAEREKIAVFGLHFLQRFGETMHLDPVRSITADSVGMNFNADFKTVNQFVRVREMVMMSHETARVVLLKAISKPLEHACCVLGLSGMYQKINISHRAQIWFRVDQVGQRDTFERSAFDTCIR